MAETRKPDEPAEPRKQRREIDHTLDDTDWFERLYDHFAPVRAEAIEKGYTDDEINAWIDEAVAAVRAGKHG